MFLEGQSDTLTGKPYLKLRKAGRVVFDMARGQEIPQGNILEASATHTAQVISAPASNKVKNGISAFGTH